MVSGRLKKRGFAVIFDDPEFQREDAEGDLLHAGRIVPIYRLTAGIAAPRLRLAMREAIDRAGLAYPEYLPADLLRRGAPRRGSAGRSRAPTTRTTPRRRDAALRRLAFDELLALQLGMVGRRRQRVRSQARPLEVDDARDADVRAALVGALSREARAGGRADRATRRPRRPRSGPTWPGTSRCSASSRATSGRARPRSRPTRWPLVAGAGRQGALLAPTDLLARQHGATLGDLLEPLGVPVTLLTGSLSAAGTRNALEAIADGRAGVVVGTHALLQERVRFADLGLVVDRRAAPLRRRAARPARGEGRRDGRRTSC